jgi:hypothetical protein
LEGGEKMKRKMASLTVMTLFLAAIVSSACLAPTYASVPYHDHVSASGVTQIDIPGHPPKTQISVIHFDGGDHGAGDYLEVALWTFIPPLQRYVWATAAIVTDNPSEADFNKNFVYAGILPPPKILLVDRCELQVYRIGKTVFAYWMEPIVSTGVTLPPGCLLINGYGSSQTQHLVLGCQMV